MADMTTIETAARVYSEEVKRLMQVVSTRDTEQQEIAEKYEHTIARLLGNCQESINDVYRYLNESLNLFESPKTRTFGDVKVGFVKQRDSVEYSNPELIIQRIRQLLPDKYDALVRTELSLSKDGLRELSPKEQELIGVQFVAGASVPSVRLLDKDTMQILKAMEKVSKE